jgi:hypothetical protein
VTAAQAPSVEERAMHLQIRTKPTNSPPDVEKLLGHLAKAGVNLAGAGGSDVEFGGEFAFAPEDGHEQKAYEVLDANQYTYQVLEYPKDPALTLCWLENKPGELHRCISDVAAVNLQRGRIIRDVLIGVPESRGIPVQVYSEEVRTPQAMGGGSKGI